MTRFLTTVGLVLVLLAGAGWELAERRKVTFATQRLALLEKENTRLRDLIARRDSQSPEEAAQQQEIENAVAEIRRLSFLNPVAYNVLSRSGIRQTLNEKLAEQYSDKEFENLATGYAALGLLPRGYPLKQKFIDLLGEQVAAFYDQHQHKLFMFEDAKLNSGQNRIVLAHELTHALQDQHFGLRNLPLEIKNNDDRAMAASALIEGDATLVMSEYMLGNFSWGTVRDSLGGLLSQNMEQLQNAPRFLRETLLFPYLRGQQFCVALQSSGGYDSISRAYQQPPSSSAQILHPGKFLAETREEPIEIEWSDTAARGEKPLADNVLGEFGTRLLLADSTDAAAAEKAADGWRGDRYLVFNDGNAFAWKSVWASQDEAREFWNAMQRHYAAGFGEPRSAHGSNLFFTDSPRFVRVVLTEENEVVVIDATTRTWAEALVDRFAPEVHDALRK